MVNKPLTFTTNTLIKLLVIFGSENTYLYETKYPSKICKSQTLKKFKGYGLLKHEHWLEYILTLEKWIIFLVIFQLCYTQRAVNGSSHTLYSNKSVSTAVYFKPPPSAFSLEYSNISKVFFFSITCSGCDSGFRVLCGLNVHKKWILFLSCLLSPASSR